ncbi:GumC family protein [Flavobacterium sp.]|uniref:GumC family protein n=1 Tax=Flavobacterium sp. TaxID=239 RepID=UPI003D0A8052
MNENIRILRPFFRGLPIVIASVIIAVLIAKKYLNYVTPMYESTAKLKLADIQEGVPSANLFKDLDVFASANKIATEIEVLKSKNLIQKSVSDLSFSVEIYRKGDFVDTELYDNSPILIQAFFTSPKAFDKRYQVQVINDKSFLFSNPGSTQHIKGEFGKVLTIEFGKVLITKNESFLKSKKNAQLIDNYEFECLSEEKLLEKITKNLDIVSVDKDVPVIRINLKSNVPEKAALFVNKLAENYIQDYIENKYKAANITVDFLKNEIQGANKKLVNSEKDIQNYRDTKNIINIRQETETDLRKISQLKIQQTNIKMNLDAIKDLNKYIAQGKNNYLDLAVNFEAFTDLLSTEMVKNIKKLQAEKKDLLLTYTLENEKVQVVDAKLKDLIDYQIESIKNTEKNLQIKYDELSSDINEAEKVFIGLPEKEKILTTLNREFNLYEKNYNFLNEKRIEAEIAKSAKIAFHKIISPAEISKTPVSPIRSIIIIIAAFLGFLGSVLLIYVVHFIKAKVNDVFTIEKNSTIPVVLTTPFLKDNIENVFLKDCIQLELKGVIADKNIISITSFDQAKDHLFHSYNFYNALKVQGKKILVMDATGQLEGNVDPADYLNFSEAKYMRFTKSHFTDEIKTRMEAVDLCIVHNQAIQDDKLALLFMSIANQNLFVLDSRKTSEKTVIKIEALRDEFHLPNLWFILNKDGYNPSLIYELKKTINRFRNK